MLTKTSTSFAGSASLRHHHQPRREKLFGYGRPRPMSRHAKVLLMKQARALMRPTDSGKHWGKITAKHLDVFRALLWDFHNAKTGWCFPSYEAIAEKAVCARSTVHLAITALEDAGLLVWVHRIRRVYEHVRNMFGDGVHGQRSRVERTSNAYSFAVPPDAESSKSEDRSGTVGQVTFSLVSPPIPAPLDVSNPLEAALMRLEKAVDGASRRLGNERTRVEIAEAVT